MTNEFKVGEESFVYVLKNKINGMKYVGSTKNVKQRMRQHRHIGDKKTRIAMAIKEYGLDSFNLEILGKFELNKSKEIESQTIKSLNTVYPNGYNMAHTSVGTTGLKMTEEQKKAISKRQKGSARHISEEAKLKLAELCRIRNKTMEHRKLVSKAKTGIKMKPEHVAKMSMARKGKKAWGTKIIIDGITYNHMKEAAHALGVHNATISWRAKNKWPGYVIVGRFPLSKLKPSPLHC